MVSNLTLCSLVLSFGVLVAGLMILRSNLSSGGGGNSVKEGTLQTLEETLEVVRRKGEVWMQQAAVAMVCIFAQAGPQADRPARVMMSKLFSK